MGLPGRHAALVAAAAQWLILIDQEARPLVPADAAGLPRLIAGGLGYNGSPNAHGKLFVVPSGKLLCEVNRRESRAAEKRPLARSSGRLACAGNGAEMAEEGKRQGLKAKFQIGSVHGKINYKRGQSVFHHSDIPKKAQQAREEVKRSKQRDALGLSRPQWDIGTRVEELAHLAHRYACALQRRVYSVSLL